jgi:hypothetical protein
MNAGNDIRCGQGKTKIFYRHCSTSGLEGALELGDRRPSVADSHPSQHPSVSTARRPTVRNGMASVFRYASIIEGMQQEVNPGNIQSGNRIFHQILLFRDSDIKQPNKPYLWSSS